MMLPFLYLNACPQLARILCPWPCICIHQTDAISATAVCRYLYRKTSMDDPCQWGCLTLHTLSNIFISLIFSLYLLMLGQANTQDALVLTPYEQPSYPFVTGSAIFYTNRMKPKHMHSICPSSQGSLEG